MRELSRPDVIEVLKELSTAVGADAGCALYVGDGEGVMHLAASAGHRARAVRRAYGSVCAATTPRTRPRTWCSHCRPTTPSFLVLARRDGTDFTQQDLTLGAAVHAASCRLDPRARGWAAPERLDPAVGDDPAHRGATDPARIA